MSLLRDIQNACTDSSSDIASLLRKCKVLASRLKNEEFKAWVDNELNGYPDRTSVPLYRRFSTESHGNFSNGYWTRNDAIIPPRLLPEHIRDFASTCQLTQPISSYASVIGSEDRNSLAEHWPPDFVVAFGGKIYEDMTCFGAWKIIPYGTLVGVVDTVKTRILSFVLEIEDVDPDAGEASPGEIPVSQDKVTHIFNTTINGNVQNVATGGTQISQSAVSNVSKGDFSSLEIFLRDAGVSEDALADLSDVLRADRESGTTNALGPSVQGWIARATKSIGSAGSKVATSAIGSVIGKAIALYLGIH